MTAAETDLPPGAKLLYTGEQIRSELVRIWRSLLADITDGSEPVEIVLVPILTGAIAVANDSKRTILGMGMGVTIHECPIRIFRTEGETLVPPTTKGLEGDSAALISGRDIVILDDLTDGGETLRLAKECVAELAPAAIHTAVVLEKRSEAATVTVPDYACFQMEYDKDQAEHHWVFGYGMDLREELRELDAIYELKV